MDLRRLVQLGLYTVPSFFSKGVSLLLLPVYVAHLSVAQFGQLELFVTVLTLVQQGLQLGWPRAFVRFFHEDGVTAPDLTLSLLLMRFLTQLPLLPLLLLGGAQRMAGWLTTDPALGNGLYWVLALCVLRDLIHLFDLQFRVRERAVPYALMHVGYATFQFVAVYFVLAVQGGGVVGVLMGQAVASLVLLAILFVFQSGWLREAFALGRVDAALSRRLLRFGLPLAPVAVLAWVMTRSDRYMLRWLLAEGENMLEWIGLYGFAGRAASLVMMLLVGLGAFFLPYAFRIHREPTGPARLARALQFYSAVLIAVALVLSLGLPLAVERYFAGYRASVPVVFLLIAGIIAYRVSHEFSIGIDLAERNRVRLLAAVLATAVNLVGNWLLIPRFQIMGSGVTSLLAGLVYAAIVLPSSQRYLPVPYAWSTWLFTIGWTAGASAVLALAPEWRWGYAGLGAGVFAVLFLRAGGLVRPSEAAHS